MTLARALNALLRRISKWHLVLCRAPTLYKFNKICFHFSLVTGNAVLIWGTCQCKQGNEDLYKKTESQSRLKNICNVLLISFASIIVPSGYSNDYKMYHPRIKGGLYIILNYLLNMAIMGVSFGFAIDRYVPDQFVNIPLPTKSHLVISTKSTEVRVGLGFGDLIIPVEAKNVSKSTFFVLLGGSSQPIDPLFSRSPHFVIFGSKE